MVDLYNLPGVTSLLLTGINIYTLCNKFSLLFILSSMYHKHLEGDTRSVLTSSDFPIDQL